MVSLVKRCRSFDFKNTMLSRPKGDNNCTPDGPLHFESHGAGWSNPDDLSSGRPTPARYDGLFLNGDRVVLSYTVADTKIRELPAYESAADLEAFTRSFSIETSGGPLALSICDVPGAASSIDAAQNIALLDDG